MRPAVLLLVWALTAAACSDGADETVPTASPDVAVTTIPTKPVVTATSTTRAATSPPTVAPAPPFVATAEEARSLVDEMVGFGMAVNQGFNDAQAAAFLSLFHPSAQFTDPVNPSLKPDVSLLHELYGGGEDGSEALKEKYPDRAVPHGESEVDAVFGNGHGAVTAGAIEIGEPVGSLELIRQLAVLDGKAEWGMHRFEVEMLRSYPQEVVELLYLASGDLDRVSEIVAMADEFMARFEQAWTSGDASTIGMLYAPEAVREDALAGSPTGSEIEGWLQQLFERHPNLAITTMAVYASSFGPAAVQQIEADTGSASCSMTILSIWNLNSQKMIETEYVYYTTETVNACDWTT